MSIEKYDRFEWGREIILEYTGVSARIGDNKHRSFACKVVVTANKENQIDDLWVISEKDLSKYPHKKLPRPATHPLLDEVARMAKDDTGFLDEFLDGFARLWEIMTPEQKRDLIFSLNERLPQEIKDSFQAPGGCCGEHDERFSAHRAMLARQRNGLPLDEKEIRPKKEDEL